MTHSAAPSVGWYQYRGSTGGRGLSEAHVVHAQADHNPTEYNDDESLTITFSRTGRTTHYRPATADDVTEIRAENRARIDGNARLGVAVAELLRTSGVCMARWMQRGGSGVYVHTAGSEVAVWWWYSTEAERKDSPAPWTGGEGEGVRAQVVAVLDGAGLRYSSKGSDLVLTIEDNPKI
ncbi:hypothetical protein [Streptomyces graminilatus]|uniref:hypothetical protein n=1 Tax=Streptomyces graminilatus TaxID=1464070 RepID=UPI0006E33994|nr:hypothetical protein [Streptomyces graminilatus]